MQACFCCRGGDTRGAWSGQWGAAQVADTSHRCLPGPGCWSWCFCLFFLLAEQRERPECSVPAGDLWPFSCQAATRADASLLSLHMWGKPRGRSWGEGGGATGFCVLIFLLMLPRSCGCPEAKAAARSGFGFVSSELSQAFNARWNQSFPPIPRASWINW